MENIFNLSMFFLIVYTLILFKPGDITWVFQKLAGIFFFTFCVLFLIYIYKLKNSISSVLVTCVLLFIFMYVIQIVVGSITYYLYKK